MKRVVILTWKNRHDQSLEVFSNLKILCESYPCYNYNTLNNYLSKARVPYENTDVRIERKVVLNIPVKPREIAMVGHLIKKSGHDEENQNLDYWLGRPVAERLEAVTKLRAQVIGKKKRMNRKYGRKRRIQ